MKKNKSLMRKNILLKLTVLVFSAFLAISCDDTTDTIGIGMAGNLDNFIVSTDTFCVSTRTEKMDSVLARCANARLGSIRDPETGALIKSSYMTQFYILEGRSFPERDSLRSFTSEAAQRLHYNGTETKDSLNIHGQHVAIDDIVTDSIHLIVYPINVMGDSLQPMRLSVHELEKPLTEENFYYSNYDPIKEGYVDASKCMKEYTFTLADQAADSADRYSSDYSTYFRIPLNEEYTDNKGNTYNNYGTYILRKYYEDKNNFSNFLTFIKNVCPGLYLKMDNGTGAMATIRGTALNLYFKVRTTSKAGNDTIVNSFSTFFGTEEIMQATNYETNKETVESLIKDETCTYMKTPIGLYTIAELPVNDIYKGHEKDSLSSAKVTFKCMNYESTDNFKFAPSQHMLMIPADSVVTFFEKQKLTNGRSSFLTAYSTSANAYSFTNIAGMVAYMHNLRAEGLKNDANWEARHPNWNKVALLPVETTSSASGTVAAIYNNLGLTSTKLVGGTQQIEPITLTVVYNRLSEK